MERRPLKTRGQGWVQILTRTLLKTSVQPDTISLIGLLFALGAGFLLWQTETKPYSLYFIGSAVLVQWRLLCNMLDGLIAIEGNRHSKTGDLFNEIPDRFEDIFILVGAGYAAHHAELGWIAATLSVLTAYIRAFGKSVGAQSYFVGPMAKPHRMFVITIACLLSLFFNPTLVFKISLLTIVIGTLITSARRIQLIAQELNQK